MSEKQFEFNQIHYNAAILYMKDLWQRDLTPHEEHLLKRAYDFARQVELEQWMSKEVIEWQQRQVK